MAQRNLSSCLREIDARRICIIKPSALGDVVQSLPLLRVLRLRFPQAHIAWVINRALAPLLEDHPDLDEIVAFERRGTWRDWQVLLQKLRTSNFDLVFDLQGLFRSAVMALATRAPVRVGLESAREGAHWVRHFAVADTGLDVSPHVRYTRIANALGISEISTHTRLSIPSEARSWAAAELAKLNGPVLAIHPGAGWVTKRWPPGRFASVACKAIRTYSMSPVVLGTADEAPLAQQVEQTIRSFLPATPLLNLAGRTSLKQLAALLERAAVLLTNDSGPMQLAAGLGTPVVGIFTCTSPGISGPPGQMHELVATNVSCAGSYRKRCPRRGRKHLACMEELDVERVWEAFCRLMRKKSRDDIAA